MFAEEKNSSIALRHSQLSWLLRPPRSWAHFLLRVDFNENQKQQLWDKFAFNHNKNEAQDDEQSHKVPHVKALWINILRHVKEPNFPLTKDERVWRDVSERLRGNLFLRKVKGKLLLLRWHSSYEHQRNMRKINPQRDEMSYVEGWERLRKLLESMYHIIIGWAWVR